MPLSETSSHDLVVRDGIASNITAVLDAAIVQADSKREDPEKQLKALYLRTLKQFFTTSYATSKGRPYLHDRETLAEAAGELARHPALQPLAGQIFEEVVREIFATLEENKPGDWMDDLSSVEEAHGILRTIVEEMSHVPEFHQAALQLMNTPALYGLSSNLRPSNSDTITTLAEQNTEQGIVLISVRSQVASIESIELQDNTKRLIGALSKRKKGEALQPTLGELLRTRIDLLFTLGQNSYRSGNRELGISCFTEYLRLVNTYGQEIAVYPFFQICKVVDIFQQDQEMFQLFLDKLRNFPDLRERANILAEMSAAHFRQHQDPDLAVDLIAKRNIPEYLTSLQGFDFLKELIRFVANLPEQPIPATLSAEPLQGSITKLIASVRAMLTSAPKERYTRAELFEKLKNIAERLEKGSLKADIYATFGNVLTSEDSQQSRTWYQEALLLGQNLEPSERLEIACPLIRTGKADGNLEEELENGEMALRKELTGPGYISMSGTPQRILSDLCYEYALADNIAAIDRLMQYVAASVQYPEDALVSACQAAIRGYGQRRDYKQVLAFVERSGGKSVRTSFAIAVRVMAENKDYEIALQFARQSKNATDSNLIATEPSGILIIILEAAAKNGDYTVCQQLLQEALTFTLNEYDLKKVANILEKHGELFERDYLVQLYTEACERFQAWIVHHHYRTLLSLLRNLIIPKTD